MVFFKICAPAHQRFGVNTASSALEIILNINHIGNAMNLHLGLTPLISLLAGILILVMPRMLNLIVALYLIAVGLIGIFGAGSLHLN